MVQTMEKGADTTFAFVIRKEFKKDLGVTYYKDLLGNITHVYLVYEDFDGSIKYFDYPQRSKREIGKMRKSIQSVRHCLNYR